MTEWITDRQPTAAEAGVDGEVWVKTHPDAGYEAAMHYTMVPAGVYWHGAGLASQVANSLLEQEAPEADEPTPTIEIPEPIRTGAAPFYVVVVSDDMGGKPGGNPIVWEHTIPKTTTLQAALRQQQRIDSRYGTTYVAECRIIPELTRHAA